MVADVFCDQEVDVPLENLAENWKKGYRPEVIRARGYLLLGYKYNACLLLSNTLECDSVRLTD